MTPINAIARAHRRAQRPHLSLLAALLCLLGTTAAAAVEVIKSPNDTREYRALELPNRLKVILVSDPDTDMAAASLSVEVGSNANPRDRDGLAHLLEHMLFLGTSKYPQPGEYKDFITRNGGHDNAYTASDETNYFFEVKASVLEPALDRFARFFIDPLFNADYVDRERQVVQSEYLGRMKSDGRRTYSATRQVINPEHPASMFAVGNLDTLGDRPGSNVRDELIAFYERYYSSNLMALTVVGRESLDVLEGWVRSRFSPIPDRDVARPVPEVPLFTPGRLPVGLDVVPEKEQRSLTLTFPIPPVREHWASKPVAHVGHLLGHEGEGSLLVELKKRGWAQGLSAGLGYSDERDATFSIGIELTPEGHRHTEAIVALVFANVELIRSRGIERWIFDENRRLGEIGFQYQEKPDPLSLARSLSSSQHVLPQREVLRGGYAYDEFRPDLIRQILDRLRPQNMVVTRVAPALETDQRTRWYDAPYRIREITKADLEAWQSPPAEITLAIPAPNPFIPERLEVRTPAVQRDVPHPLAEGPGFTLWHQQDATYGLPKSDFFVGVRSPVANTSPRNALLAQLYINLVNDGLNAFAYPANLAGLGFNLYTHMRGFSVRISGYDSRQDELLKRILAALTDFKVDPRRFEIMRADLKRGLQNTRRDQPYAQAMLELQTLIVEPRWSITEQLAVVDTLTATQLQSFAADLLSKVDVVALSHGNADEAVARSLGEQVRSALVAKATPVTVPRARVHKLRRGDRLRADMRLDHPESALVLYLQGEDKALSTRAHAGVLAQLLSAPFFDRLRTERKLGYVVFANAFSVLDTAGLVFIAQSPIADAATLAKEMRAFFVDYAPRVDTLTPAQLSEHQAALVARLMEEERQLSERSDRYWTEIDRDNAAFDTREKLVDAVKAVTPASLARFYHETLLAKPRRELVVGVRGEQAGASLAPDGSITAEQMRLGRELFPG